MSLLLDHAFAALLLLLSFSTLLLSPPAQRCSIICLVPLPERRSVDLDHRTLGQSVRAHEFVVGGVVNHADDTGFPRDALAAPGEVARVETQGAEFPVAAAGAHEMDALSTNTCVGRLAAFLECSATMELAMDWTETFGLCIPLLAIVCSLGTGCGALVT